MTNDSLNIVFICDNNYVMPTIVAITSLQYNRDQNFDYHIYIICEDLEPERELLFKELEQEHFKIQVTFVKADSANKNFERSYSAVSSAALHKFNIANILFNIDKVLYIDGDVIIQDSLVNLYSTDIGRYYAAVVKDGPRKRNSNHGKKHLFYNASTYFNSGVMLLNLKALRQDNIPAKLMAYRTTQYNYFMDQDAFNRIFEGHVTFLPYYDNVLLHLIGLFLDADAISIICSYYNVPLVTTVEALMDKGTILHYTFYKPWKYYDIPQAEKWAYYYYLSPLGKQQLQRQSYIEKICRSKTYKAGRVTTYVPIKLYKLIKKIMKFFKHKS